MNIKEWKMEKYHFRQKINKLSKRKPFTFFVSKIPKIIYNINIKNDKGVLIMNKELVILPDYMITFLEDCKRKKMNVEESIIETTNDAVEEFMKKKPNRDTFIRAWVSEGYMEDEDDDPEAEKPIEVGTVYEIHSHLYLIIQVKTKKNIGFMAVSTEKKKSQEAHKNLANIVFPEIEDLDKEISKLGKRAVVV